MSENNPRYEAKMLATHRESFVFQEQENDQVKIFGENVFDILTAVDVPDHLREKLKNAAESGNLLTLETAEEVATTITRWAKSKGVTHFCHWFQPMTGSTAEKHDSLLDFDNDGAPIEILGAKQLMYGEPDASSFPNGGSRSTFEARGYTAWDVSSPFFILEGARGNTLCIPTAFVTYHGDALDIKTPLLRSIRSLNKQTLQFLKLTGNVTSSKITVNIGAEQEYFLVDKSFYYERPDLVMTGRTLIGPITSRNQQLDDHYFGPINDRVLNFMQELDYELYRLGIPSKTRHNEVAPGQFELAPIFRNANLANDHNQLVMHVLRKIAAKHNFVALLHEKPFAGVNGSGKHINWSISDNKGCNLLNPGKNPHKNYLFLLMMASIIRAVDKHAKMIRASIGGNGNDHRLGANEAPPSIISVYLGDTLDKIFQSIINNEKFVPEDDKRLDLAASEVVSLLQDDTDRNRTSPFAFTGNKFEFRAVGSSKVIGFPVTILNTAITDALKELNLLLESRVAGHKLSEKNTFEVIREYLKDSYRVVFNGDGYSDDWLVEAEKRGLPNLKTTPEAYTTYADKKCTAFLKESGVYNDVEIQTFYNVSMERYNTYREIEFATQIGMIDKYVIPSAVEYKLSLGEVLLQEKNLGIKGGIEFDLYKNIHAHMEQINKHKNSLLELLDEEYVDSKDKALTIAHDMMPLSDQLTHECNEIENMLPDHLWRLPTYFDMLFIR